MSNIPHTRRLEYISIIFIICTNTPLFEIFSVVSDTTTRTEAWDTKDILGVGSLFGVSRN